jgi:hypothetical protein
MSYRGSLRANWKGTAGLSLGSRLEDRDYSMSKGDLLRYALRHTGENL